MFENMKKVEVKSNGIVVGYTYDEGATIEFLDNDEAKKVLDKINTGTPIGISSRKTGKIDENGFVTDMSDLNELGIVSDDFETQNLKLKII